MSPSAIFQKNVMANTFIAVLDSGCLLTLSACIVSVKAGQGEECSYLLLLWNSSYPHLPHVYTPVSSHSSSITYCSQQLSSSSSLFNYIIIFSLIIINLKLYCYDLIMKAAEKSCSYASLIRIYVRGITPLIKPVKYHLNNQTRPFVM